MTAQPPFLLLGKVLRPHGVRGELRIEVLTDYPERIGPESKVYLGLDPDNPSKARAFQVAQSRIHQKYLILQLVGVEGREAADLLRQQYVMVPIEDAIPLEEGEFYLYQLIGIQVYSTAQDFLGEVTEVLETGANDVYIVHGPRGELLLPAIDECIVEIDLEANRMTVELMDGLLDESA